MTQAGSTFLEITVGAFRLALRADCVLGVLTEVRAGEPASFRGRALPFADLGVIFGGAPRERVPFGVVFEAESGAVAVGVDAVGHVRPGPTQQLETMPSFGLLCPALFEGVLREEQRCMLVLAPDPLAALAAPALT